MAVYFYSVQCTGTESTLGQYSHNTIGSSSISHNDDVSYQCIESKWHYNYFVKDNLL